MTLIASRYWLIASAENSESGPADRPPTLLLLLPLPAFLTASADSEIVSTSPGESILNTVVMSLLGIARDIESMTASGDDAPR